MNTLKSKIILLFFGVSGLIFQLSADITLVKNGKSNAAIILGIKPTKAAQLGALELQYFIKKISGTELPIRTENAPENVKIYIGDSNAAQKAGLKAGNFSGETYQIKTVGNQIFLIGNDTRNFENVNYRDYTTFPKPYFETYGTLFAVYDFLESRCGVIFTGPWEDSVSYPQKKTLTVSPFQKKFTPPLDGIREIYTDDRSYTVLPFSERERRLWSFRWRQAEFYGKASHSCATLYYQYWDKAKSPLLAGEFKKKRPELFAAGYKGTNSFCDPIVRKQYPNDKDLPPQPCFTHPDTHKHYAELAATYAKGKNVRGGWWNATGKISPEKCLMPRFPGKPFFYPIEPADSNLFCKCDQCKKLFPDLKGDFKTSNLKFYFISEIARKAATIHPGTGISTLAYIQTLPYPEKVNLPENVSVTLCITNFAWWHPGIRAAQEKEYTKWIQNEAKKRPIMLWTYLFSPHWDSRLHFHYHSFPGLYPWKTGKMMKKFFNDGVKGWFTEVELQYSLPEAYVSAKLAFDPSLDPDKIIDDWFSASFGKAAPAMKKIYKISEDAWWNKNNYPKEWTADIANPQGPRGAHNPYWGTGLHSEDVNWSIGTPERFNQIESLLKEAESLVETPFEKANLQRFIKGIWEEARKGKLQYDQKMANMGKIKQKTLRPAPHPDVKGDPRKIDWNKAKSTGLWLENKTGKTYHRNISMLAASDSEFLYLKYTELNPAGTILANNDFWTDCAELFFSEYAAMPLWHIAISPSGKIEQLKFFMKDGKEQRERGKLPLRFINDLSGNSWTWMMSIPLKELPFNPMKTGLTANFFRTRPGKESAAAWSPLFFTLGYRNGLKSFGRLKMPVITYPESFFMLKSFCNDPAAIDGKSVVTDGNKGWRMWCKLGPIEQGEYYLNLRIRTDAVYPDLTNSIGFYDQSAKKVAFSKLLEIKDISGKEYKELRIGPVKLNPDMFFYLGGFRKKNVNPNKVYVDQFTLERAVK